MVDTKLSRVEVAFAVNIYPIRHPDNVHEYAESLPSCFFCLFNQVMLQVAPMIRNPLPSSFAR